MAKKEILVAFGVDIDAVAGLVPMVARILPMIFPAACLRVRLVFLVC